MSHDRSTPPADWPSLETVRIVRLTEDIYYGWWDDDTNPTFWHWCSKGGGSLNGEPRWKGAGTQDHQLVSREPLHLEPSLLWRCCGLHGWVRNGEWTGA